MVLDLIIMVYSLQRRMDDLLDMDYFLNEDDLLDDEAGVEGFYIF